MRKVLILYIVALFPCLLFSQKTIGIGFSNGFSTTYGGIKLQYNWFGGSFPSWCTSISLHKRTDLSKRISGWGALRLGTTTYSYRIHDFFDEDIVRAKDQYYHLGAEIKGSLRLLYKESGKPGRKYIDNSFDICTGYFLDVNFNHTFKLIDGQTINVNSFRKPLNMGFVFGLMATKRLAKKKYILIDIRYYHGISDLSKFWSINRSRAMELGINYFWTSKK